MRMFITVKSISHNFRYGWRQKSKMTTTSDDDDHHHWDFWFIDLYMSVFVCLLNFVWVYVCVCQLLVLLMIFFTVYTNFFFRWLDWWLSNAKKNCNKKMAFVYFSCLWTVTNSIVSHRLHKILHHDDTPLPLHIFYIVVVVVDLLFEYCSSGENAEPKNETLTYKQLMSESSKN